MGRKERRCSYHDTVCKSTSKIYYAEITLESGSKIAVQFGKPDQEGKFQIKNTFGNLSDISVYTDLDLE